MRWWFVGGAERWFGGAYRLLQLFELAVGGVEPIAERAHQCVELADQLVLKRELHLEVLDPLCELHRHTGTVPDLLLLSGRAPQRHAPRRARRLLPQHERE